MDYELVPYRRASQLRRSERKSNGRISSLWRQGMVSKQRATLQNLEKKKHKWKFPIKMTNRVDVKWKWTEWTEVGECFKFLKIRDLEKNKKRVVEEFSGHFQSLHTLCSGHEVTSLNDEQSSTKALSGSVMDTKSMSESMYRHIIMCKYAEMHNAHENDDEHGTTILAGLDCSDYFLFRWDWWKRRSAFYIVRFATAKWI